MQRAEPQGLLLPDGLSSQVYSVSSTLPTYTGRSVTQPEVGMGRYIPTSSCGGTHIISLGVEKQRLQHKVHGSPHRKFRFLQGRQTCVFDILIARFPECYLILPCYIFW